ncbi:hypothetical protein DVH05_022364 [Phytophthora capsici]|nr:hypothetical protein DVH05_022364 [Phytophthora capsici]
MSWIKSIELDNPDEEEERAQILKDIAAMDMKSSINSGGQSVEFAEIARFGNQGWLSDECIVAAATRIAAEASWSTSPNVYVSNPTFATFEDEDQRNRLVDTKDFIFSKCDECTVILCPIHINVDIAHWCGAVFDMKRRLVWVYDPLHKEDYEAEVTTLLKNVYLPLVNPAGRGASAMVSAVACMLRIGLIITYPATFCRLKMRWCP